MSVPKRSIKSTRRLALLATCASVLSLWVVILTQLPWLLTVLTLACCMGSNGLAIYLWQQEAKLKDKLRHEARDKE